MTVLATTVTCGACLQPVGSHHRCNVPPQIDTALYTTAALEYLAAYLTRVVADRRRQQAGAA